MRDEQSKFHPISAAPSRWKQAAQIGLVKLSRQCLKSGNNIT